MTKHTTGKVKIDFPGTAFYIDESGPPTTTNNLGPWVKQRINKTNPGAVSIPLQCSPMVVPNRGGRIRTCYSPIAPPRLSF
uniref:Uncharacterized protein n=1 Tax=Picea glauca TaxID=3330 RepID=A0A101LW36_PICGL|nr:hypothetical protein ABT39_MTgene1511 [Picea glauca]